MKNRLIAVALLFVPLAFARPACAGPLRFFTSGGPESAIVGELTFSEGDVDLQHPASLIGGANARLSLSREYESVYYRKQGDKTDIITAKKRKVAFYYPFNKSKKFRSAYGGDLFGSNFKIVSQLRIEDTSLYYKGSGSSNAVAQQLGPVRLGYFINHDGGSGRGFSQEAVNSLEGLDQDSILLAQLSAKKEGVQIAADINKRISAGYLKSDVDYRVSLDLIDSNEDYRIPGRLCGENREIGAEYKLNSRYAFSASYGHTSISNLDYISYNTDLDFGSWLSFSEYKMKSLYIRKTPSENHTTIFGYQNYDAYYYLAGTIDPFGDFTGLSGNFLYHSNGMIDRQTLRYSTQWRRGGYRYRFRYDYSFGDAMFHFDSQWYCPFCIILPGMPAPPEPILEDRRYDYSQHLLGFGVEKEITKNTVFKYSFIQVVPIFDNKEKAAAPPGPPAPPQPKKKTRGGTLHLFTIEYLF